MNTGDKICGFSYQRCAAVPDVSGKLNIFYHEKSGARLYFLDREDRNKTFAITFKTIPEDSTGVFHIIEHSVLCGSEKYPVKEPFVELLKSSLQTFLNAFTFPDKTMYPVSSRNDKDFENLVKVYLDAVFYPLMKKSPNVFYQEGWHNEIEGERVTKNGVVFNEMKGEYSSSDTLEAFNINEMLYRGSPYALESGGHPEKIPELTYESFVRTHDKFYHPSNAEIFLDGSVNLESVLSLLDSYLSAFEKRDCNFEIAPAVSCCNERRRVPYEISKGEDEKDKTRLAIGFMTNRADEIDRSLAIGLLIDVLTQTNASPLKKKILDSELCEDFYISSYNGILENSICASFRNVKDGEEERLEELFYDSIREICREGIDRDRLRAALNNLEFRQRERDFGTTPKGIIYAMAVEEASLYGFAPEITLEFSSYIERARALVDEGHFEKLLSEIFLENDRCATLILTPSSTLGEENEKRAIEAEASLYASLSKKEINAIKDAAKALSDWQSEENSEEALLTLPRLDVSDISKNPERIPEREALIENSLALIHDIETAKISYYDLYFDVSELDSDELFTLALTLPLFSNLATNMGDAQSLQKRIKSELGYLDISHTVLPKFSDYSIFVTLSVASLEHKRDLIPAFIKEVLFESKVDVSVMESIYKQMKISLEESFVSTGHQAAITRALAKCSPEYAAKEYLSGYEFYKKLSGALENPKESLPQIKRDIERLISRIFTKERVIYSSTGIGQDDLLSKIAEVLPNGSAPCPVRNISTLPDIKEGILIPSTVSYAALCAKTDFTPEERGAMHVARMILNYEYLWGEIRIKGGAYGAGFVSRAGGNLAFYSYRDPSGMASLEVYKKAPEALREYARSNRDISGFIISAIGDLDPIMTPRLRGSAAAIRRISGRTYETECRIRKALLESSPESLIGIAEKIEKAFLNSFPVIVGGEEKLTPCNFFDKILKI